MPNRILQRRRHRALERRREQFLLFLKKTAGNHPKRHHLRDCWNDRNRDDFRTLQLREDQRNPAEIRGQNRQSAHFRGERRRIIALDGEIAALRDGERVVLQFHRGFYFCFCFCFCFCFFPCFCFVGRWKRGNRKLRAEFELLRAGCDELRQLPRVLHKLRKIAGIQGVFQVGPNLIDDVRRDSTSQKWKRGNILQQKRAKANCLATGSAFSTRSR